MSSLVFLVFQPVSISRLGLGWGGRGGRRNETTRPYRKIYILSKIRLTMVNINITTLSSKGQIVIPLEMRTNMREGDKILLIQDGDRIILEKTTKLSKKFKEDLEFARRTEESYQRIERGEGISMDFDKFIQEIKKR